jgi:aldose 1-epimerase
MKRTQFGRLADGRPIDLYELTNGNGTVAAVTTYGATLVRLVHRGADIVLGFDDVSGYVAHKQYFGATIGRYANRIAHAEFALDGRRHRLSANDGEHSLHGGTRGFDRRVWSAAAIASGAAPGVELAYTSAAGEEGYPATLTATVRYLLLDSDTLRIEYNATADAPTIVNLTNHSYFNLAGHASGPTLQHELTIAADRFTPVDSSKIPTGELCEVKGTPFDFRISRPIAAGLRPGSAQLHAAGGYDHNFVLNGPVGTLRPAAAVLEPRSARTLELFTTDAGLQFYGGQLLDGSDRGKGGVPYQQYQGFCLETQRFPNTPNTPQFPSAVLLPGERYSQITEFRLGLVQ